jgi:hypothetical protein
LPEVREKEAKELVNKENGSPGILILEEVEHAVPVDNEILIIVHTASINQGD